MGLRGTAGQEGGNHFDTFLSTLLLHAESPSEPELRHDLVADGRRRKGKMARYRGGVALARAVLQVAEPALLVEQRHGREAWARPAPFLCSDFLSAARALRGLRRDASVLPALESARCFWTPRRPGGYASVLPSGFVGMAARGRAVADTADAVGGATLRLLGSKHTVMALRSPSGRPVQRLRA